MLTKFAVDIKKQIEKYIKENPYPEDKQMHAFAAGANMVPHELEDEIYSLLSDYVLGKKKATKAASEEASLVDFEKEADLKKMMATLGLIASLSTPAKGIADDAMLALAKANASKAAPVILQDINKAVDNLPWYLSGPAKAFGLEGVADSLSQAQENLSMLKQHGLPTFEGDALASDIKGMQTKALNEGTVDIGQGSDMYDKLTNFLTQSDDAIKNYQPSINVAQGK